MRALALAEQASKGVTRNLEALKELRDEAARAHERDLPSLFQQIYVEQAIVERPGLAPRPSLAAPTLAKFL